MYASNRWLNIRWVAGDSISARLKKVVTVANAQTPNLRFEEYCMADALLPLSLTTASGRSYYSSLVIKPSLSLVHRLPKWTFTAIEAQCFLEPFYVVAEETP